MRVNVFVAKESFSGNTVIAGTTTRLMEKLKDALEKDWGKPWDIELRAEDNKMILAVWCEPHDRDANSYLMDFYTIEIVEIETEDE